MASGNRAWRSALPSADFLLRFYPPRWRERYGEEFLAMVGTGPLHAQQVIDVLSGAVDAWLSAEVREVAGVCPAAPGEGGSMKAKSLAACTSTNYRFTTQDSLIGAGVMLLSTLVIMGLGVAARREGWLVAGEALTSVGLLASMMLSMPFWLMKGQPRKAQVAVVGTTVVLLLALAFVAAAT